MGLVDKFKRGGGGFLNNVDGLIASFSLTSEPDFGNGTKEKKAGAFNSLWAVIGARVDGAEADQPTHLFAGSADDFVISEDGQSITPVGDGGLWGFTAFAKFYESLVTAGLADIDPGPGEPLDFGHIAGARVRFVQVKDEDAMKRSAELYKKNRTKATQQGFNELGQKKGKDGKFYDQRSLQVSEVYSVGNTVAGKVASAKGKGTAAKTTALKSKTPPAPEGIADFAEETLIDILSSAPENTLGKTKINVAVTRKLLKDDRQNAVRQYLFNDANLAALAEKGVISVDTTGKEAVISLG